MTEKEHKDKIMEIVRKRGDVTVLVISRRLSISREAAQSLLSGLVKEGKLVNNPDGFELP